MNTIYNIHNSDFTENNLFENINFKSFFECAELNKILEFNFSGNEFESIIFSLIQTLEIIKGV